MSLPGVFVCRCVGRKGTAEPDLYLALRPQRDLADVYGEQICLGYVVRGPRSRAAMAAGRRRRWFARDPLDNLVAIRTTRADALLALEQKGGAL